MIVNKKSRMALTVIAFSMLLPLPIFAMQQPETWRQTFGRWGSNVKNYIGMGPSTVQIAGTLGALGLLRGSGSEISDNAIYTLILAGLFGAPALANYIRFQQRQNQNPNDRSHQSSYLVSPVVSGAAAGAALYAIPELLAGRTPSLDSAIEGAKILGGAAALSGFLSGSVCFQQEPIHDSFKKAKNALVEYVTAVINQQKVFDLLVFNQLTTKYTKDLEEVIPFLEKRRPSEKKLLTAEELTQVTILDYLIDKRLITKKDFGGVSIKNPRGILQILKRFGEKYALPGFDNMSDEDLTRVLFSQFYQNIIQNINYYLDIKRAPAIHW